MGRGGGVGRDRGRAGGRRRSVRERMRSTWDEQRGRCSEKQIDCAALWGGWREERVEAQGCRDAGARARASSAASRPLAASSSAARPSPLAAAARARSASACLACRDATFSSCAPWDQLRREAGKAEREGDKKQLSREQAMPTRSRSKQNGNHTKATKSRAPAHAPGPSP